MNTAIQTKTHTAKSAKSKSLHNERKDNSIKNPNYVVLQKDNYHKFTQKEPIKAPKRTAKLQQQEKALKKELATIQSKINTYQKRVEEYSSREKPNIPKIEALKAKIEDLKQQKNQIPRLSDKRGKPQKIKYVEFELSLTNSNHIKHSKDVQKAFYEAFKELRKDEIFKDLKSVSQVMHLDQHSLHIHSLNKLVNNKSWNSIVQSQKQATDKDGRDVYSRLQNKFNSIVREKFKELNLEIEQQEKGKKYLPLKKYKELTNYKAKEQQQQAQQPQPKKEINIDLSKNEERQESIKQPQQKLFLNFKKVEEKFIKENQQQPQQPQQPQKENLFKKLDEIDKKNDDNFFSELIEKTVQQQKIAKALDIRDILDNGLKKEEEKEEEKEVKKDLKEIKKMNLDGIKARQLSAFEAQKKRLNEQFKETLKSNQNETQDEKKQEKSKSKQHSRSR